MRWLYERAYRRGTAGSRWDTGVTPPEVEAFVERTPPGNAIDLGCGTGTNVLYLVQHGWLATGVDLSPLAISSARAKADWVSGASFVEGDVTRLSELGVDGPFDLALDVGCFHSVAASRRDAYAGEVARVTRPGGTLLLFAFGPRFRLPGGRATREPEIRRRFEGAFELTGVELGREPPGAAWFTLTRRPS